MELRSNQIAPVSVGAKYFENPNPPSLIVAPTAFGKSIVIAKIAESIDDRTLVLQPGKELLEQNISKYRMLGGHAAVFSASMGQKHIGETTYATIGSIKDLGAKFRNMGFKKMIIDEAHLYPREIDSMLGRFLRDSGIEHVLGLTATPLKLQTNSSRFGDPYSVLSMLTSRSKKGQFFKDIIHVSQIEEMVQLGFWSKLNYDTRPIDSSALQYNSVKSDFTEASLKEVYRQNNLHGLILDATMELLDTRKSILVFVPSVADAIELERFIPNSAAFYGDMPAKERKIKTAAFRSGRIKVAINVNLFAVGFDHPGIDGIVGGRHTASLAWYYQAYGRGTRIAAHKEDCRIIDFSGNVNKFGKLEHLKYIKAGNYWNLFGENGNKLTGIPLHEVGMPKHKLSGYSGNLSTSTNSEMDIKHGNIVMPFGKYKGTKVRDVPTDYRRWMLKEFTWSSKLQDLKIAVMIQEGY